MNIFVSKTLDLIEELKLRLYPEVTGKTREEVSGKLMQLIMEESFENTTR